MKKFSERLQRPLEYKYQNKVNKGDVQTRYFTIDSKNSDPTYEIAKNMYTKEKGVFTVSSVYNCPLQIVETGFKNVNADTIKNLMID